MRRVRAAVEFKPVEEVGLVVGVADRIGGLSDCRQGENAQSQRVDESHVLKIDNGKRSVVV